MRTVFNLTTSHLDYRKRTIAPYGSAQYDMDFIPDRDLALAKAGVLAFDALPVGWSRPVVVSPPEPAPAPRVDQAPKTQQNPGASSKVEFPEKEGKK